MSSVSSVASTTATATSRSSSTSSSSVSSTDYLSFDTEALVEAKLASRYARLDRLETEVTKTETKIAAYQTLQTTLQTLTGSLESLRGNPSSAGLAVDVFRDRTAYLTTSSGVSAESYMSATVAEGTELGSHAITVTQTARTNIVATAAQRSKTEDLGWSGTITLGTDGGGSANIAITATMSLADIADTINAQKNSTGVRATVMKVSDDSYQLTLTTTETGRTITAADADGTLLSSSDRLGLLDSGGAIADDRVLQAARDAVLTVNGVTVTRSGNDIDDLIDGVTLHLYSDPPSGTTLTLEVDRDLTAIKTAITSFVEAYNAFRDIVIANQSTDDSATLFGDVTLRETSRLAQSILTGSVDGNSLGVIGITLDDDNRLVINSATLENALLDDIDSIKTLFSTEMTASSGDLRLLRHGGTDASFTVNVAVDSDGALTSASIGGDSSMFVIKGNSIVGAAGTAYEGLSMVYTGSTSKAITVTLTQGLAQKLHTAADAVANAEGGTLKEMITQLKGNTTTLNDRISALESATQSYASSLYTLYGTIASKLSSAQTTLDLLKALLNADSD